MKMLLLCLLACSSLPLLAQYEVSYTVSAAHEIYHRPNRLNDNGNRIGRWVVLLDDSLRECIAAQARYLQIRQYNNEGTYRREFSPLYRLNGTFSHMEVPADYSGAVHFVSREKTYDNKEHVYTDSICHYQNGLPHGLAQGFTRYKGVRSLTPYVAGRRHGVVMWMNAGSQYFSFVGRYEEGKPVGRHYHTSQYDMRQIQYDTSGHPLFDITLSETGDTLWAYYYRNGTLHGRCVEVFNRKMKVYYDYADGRMVATGYINEDGVLVMQTNGVVCLPVWRQQLQSALPTLTYPPIAMEAGISGKVLVECSLNNDGKVTYLNVLKAPHRSLGEAVSQWLSTMSLVGCNSETGTISLLVHINFDFLTGITLQYAWVKP